VTTCGRFTPGNSAASGIRFGQKAVQVPQVGVEVNRPRQGEDLVGIADTMQGFVQRGDALGPFAITEQGDVRGFDLQHGYQGAVPAADQPADDVRHLRAQPVLGRGMGGGTRVRGGRAAERIHDRGPLHRMPPP
jgi:hypothetical protein